MKLVDIDGFELVRYEPQNDLAYAMGWNNCADAIENELSNEPEIDAIPLEWLEDKELDYRTIGDKMFSDAFAVVIGEWQKEHEAQRYRNAVSILTSMRRAYLKRQITADEYMSLRRLAIAGYVREADRRLEETIKAKYTGTREVF